MPKSFASTFLVPAVLGSIGVLNLTHQHRLESVSNVAAIQLLASGMCFGVALFALMSKLNRSRID